MGTYQSEDRKDLIARAILVIVTITWIIVMAHFIVEWFGRYL